MRPLVKFLLLGGFLIAVGLGALAYSTPSSTASPEPCEDVRSTAIAPGNDFTAELVIHTCAWGFGLAAETVNVKITKTGKDGWFFDLPIEYDSIWDDRGTSSPTVQWVGSDNLVVNVSSKSRSGTIVSKQLGLTVTRTYHTP